MEEEPSRGSKNRTGERKKGFLQPWVSLLLSTLLLPFHSPLNLHPQSNHLHSVVPDYCPRRNFSSKEGMVPLVLLQFEHSCLLEHLPIQLPPRNLPNPTQLLPSLHLPTHPLLIDLDSLGDLLHAFPFLILHVLRSFRFHSPVRWSLLLIVMVQVEEEEQRKAEIEVLELQEPE